MASTSKPEVKTIAVQISPPTTSSPQGIIVEGAYIVTDGKVTLTDRDGRPVRDPDGRYHSQKLADGDNPRVIAARLTKKFRSVLRGDRKSASGFSSPLNYPPIKLA
jgi:hypothetical protein